MSDWKDLDIGNIPSDFFVNERYEIETDCCCGKWEPSFYLLKHRYEVIVTIQKHNNIKYRYRLKPLKSIRITQEISDIMFACNERMLHGIQKKIVGTTFVEFDNRPVELID